MECPTVIILFHHTTIWQLGVLYSDIVLLAAIVLKPETICRYYPKSKIADAILNQIGKQIGDGTFWIRFSGSTQ